MATPEQLAKSRKKALESPFIGKRGKGKKTIAREERQKIFDEYVSQEFLELIGEAKPEYKLDRFMGKMPDSLDITTKGDKIIDEAALAEAAKIYGAAIIKRKLS